MSMWNEVGGDPAPGDPGSILVLASDLGIVAEAAGDARQRLQSLHDNTNSDVWAGDSADAFRGRIGELPDKLQKLHDSYQKASSGLGSYGRTLSTLQTEAQAALTKYFGVFALG